METKSEKKKISQVLDKLDRKEKDRNTCPKCGCTELVMRNYDMMWHEGDLHCSDCGTYVRMFDAG